MRHDFMVFFYIKTSRIHPPPKKKNQPQPVGFLGNVTAEHGTKPKAICRDRQQRRAVKIRRSAHRQCQLRVTPTHPQQLRSQRSGGLGPANDSMRSNQSGEGDIRMAMFEADAVDCMAPPPGQLFSPRRSPTCLWFPARNKNPGRSLRDRRGQALFINARKTGAPVDRARREHRRESPKDLRRSPHLAR